MAIFKCKMCGSNLEIVEGVAVAECEYCGAKQTVPQVLDDRKSNLYDRAGHFRRNNEYDKAMGIYERILSENNTDAEAYWSLVLCRFGIEYVEDPVSHRRIPTVNRTQFTSIFDDENYKAALANADEQQREIYKAEATAINEIQKGILSISQKEEPFDVFICYKETDAQGQRTHDSVLAQEVYYQLQQDGFKVFFSRITLEDKLGSAYEPYIFAALNSAKVMIVIGTRPEHFKAVWVKNEWSRYLSLIKNGAKKMLIPAYRGMDPYDLPDEFSHLQALDMAKLGFMQDLVYSVKKMIQANDPQASATQNATITPLLKRAFMFLEDGDWQAADEYCDKVLALDPENAQAYLGKLMVELRVKKQEELKNCASFFDKSRNYQKAFRFGDEALKNMFIGYVTNLHYVRAHKAMRSSVTVDHFKEAAKLFERLGDYEDSADLAKQCYEKAEEKRKNMIYTHATATLTRQAPTIPNVKAAMAEFESIRGWKDADEKIVLCQKKIEEIKANIEAARVEQERIRIEKEKRAKRNKKIAMITVPIVCAVIVFIILLPTVIIPTSKYNSAVALMKDGKYEEAIVAFEALNGYGKSENKIVECQTAILDGKYNDAVKLMTAGKYDAAISAFHALDGYKDSATQILECRYNKAAALMKDQKYEEAIAAFKALNGYKDSASQITKCSTAIADSQYNKAVSLMNSGKYEEALAIFQTIRSYKDSTSRITKCNTAILDDKYSKALALMKAEKYQDAIVAFKALNGYKDSLSRITECTYYNALALIETDHIVEAYETLVALGNYKDSAAKAKSIYERYKIKQLSSAKVGTTVIFGEYEQDNTATNGKEDVEWLVLKKDGTKLLLISKYALEFQPYNQGRASVTWETCTIREWLNSYFRHAAFSSAEKDTIIETSLPATKNPSYSTPQGDPTKDYLFLLSVSEVESYITDKNARRCKPTKYAFANGAVDSAVSSSSDCHWWLRTLGDEPHDATSVDFSGNVNRKGVPVDSGYYAVRPAMWIDIGN